MKCDVLVVGSGPVGLVAAMALAQRGADVVAIDRRLTADPLTVRCNHVSSRSMEIFRALGMSKDVRNAGFPDDFPHDVAFRTSVTGNEFSRIKIPGRAGRRSGEVGPDTDWSTMEPPHRLNQTFLEPVMINHAEKTNNLDLKFGWELSEFRQVDDGVIATVQSASGREQIIQCKFLIGCDGGASNVRKSIGAKLEGDAVVQRVQSTFIHAPGLTDKMQVGAAWAIVNLNTQRSGTLYTIDADDRFLVHNYLRPDEEEFDSIDRHASIQTILGIDDDFEYQVIKFEDWIGRRLVANKLREGRVFLAGDSAHIWVPYAGYGMNAGIADAFGLAWQLGAYLQGWAGEKMLGAYELERLPITEQVSRFAMSHAEKMIRNRGAVPAEITDDTPEGKAARTDFGKICYDTNVDQYCCAGLNYGYYYDSSPIISYDGTEQPAYSMAAYVPSTVPGCRLPHIIMPDGSSLYDHFGEGYTLLEIGEASSGDAFLEASQETGVPLKRVKVAASEDHDFAFMIVRPDQHVAWRGNEVPQACAALLRSLAGFT